MGRSLFAPAAFAAGLVVSSTFALADPRPFTFVYDTYPIGKGQVEYEQWVTYENHTKSDPGYDALRLRHEFEIGLADNFDLSIYLASWRYEDSHDFTGTRFEEASVEGILYLSNPVTDAFGSGLYFEVAAGERTLDFEGKLLLQKDFGKWTVAYNLVLGTEIDGVFDSRRANTVDGVLGHALGVSYGIAPGWQIGGEVVAESVYADWSRYEGTTVYAGPTFSYQGGKWWVTVTPAFQLTDQADEPDFVGRVIFGYEF